MDLEAQENNHKLNPINNVASSASKLIFNSLSNASCTFKEGEEDTTSLALTSGKSTAGNIIIPSLELTISEAGSLKLELCDKSSV